MAEIILYHGTSAKYFEEIEEKGILPRNITGNKTWDGEIISKV